MFPLARRNARNSKIAFRCFTCRACGAEAQNPCHVEGEPAPDDRVHLLRILDVREWRDMLFTRQPDGLPF